MVSTGLATIGPILEAWLLPRLQASSVSITEFKPRSGAGFSAETFYIGVSYSKDGSEHQQDMVVRFQNQGSDFFLDASIGFPYQVMHAVNEHTDVPVPTLVGLENDESVLGAPFLVMFKMDGKVVAQSPNYNREGWLKEASPEQRGQVWRNSLAVMAKIHRLDWHQGFEFLADPKRGEPGLDSYLNWVEEWYSWARGDNPIALMEQTMAYLKNNRPASAPVSVLWGDPNSSNILFNDDGSICTVLDWEMASVGPAEVDLAWWLFFDKLFSEGFGVERLEGLPDRDTTIKFYEQALGRPVKDMAYYDLLATFRMAIVGMRSVDRQLELGTIPATSNARTNQPIMCMLAKQLGEPEPVVGEDFQAFAKIIGM